MKQIFNKIMDRMDNSNKIKKVLPIFILIGLISLIAGVTYAFATKTITLNDTNAISTGSISMSYTETSNIITINNALPTSDSNGEVLTNYFDFSVTSSMNLISSSPATDAYYNIIIEPLTVDSGYTALTNDQIKVYLEDITNGNTIVVNPVKISSLSDSGSNKILLSTKHTHEYGTNIISTKYRLRAWIDYGVDASSWDNNTKYEYKFRVNVNGEINSVTTNNAYEIVANEVNTNKKISYQYVNNAKVTIGDVIYNDGDNGVFLFDGTDDNGGSYSIYYYRGNVSNNNVLFGNLCWKIVRTTSTGGTKLIYNGIPTNGKCDFSNLQSDTTLKGHRFNYDNETVSNMSLSYVGYMYGTEYLQDSKRSAAAWNNTSTENLILHKSGSGTSYYYYDDINYSNPKAYSYDDNYESLVGKYTCLESISNTSCILYYVVATSSEYIYYADSDYKNNNYKIKLSDSVTYSNNTYTLVNPTDVSLKDYYNDYENYTKKYFCENNTSNCTKVNYISETTRYKLIYVTLTGGVDFSYYNNANIVFGNSITYTNGTYTLNTTTTSKPVNWSTDRTTLANGYHYTCFNTTGTCNEVYYITYFGNDAEVWYFTFTGGDNLASAKNKMFANTNNSLAKSAIDNWYNTNLSTYSSYLENTIFCNDRSFASGTNGGTLSGESNNSTLYSKFAGYERMITTYKPSLICANQNDRFSLKVVNGGTNGFGNNALIYPIGLLTADEVNMVGEIATSDTYSQNYLPYAQYGFWTMTPNYYSTSYGYVYLSSMHTVANFGNSYSSSTTNIHPVISLKYGTKYASGTGTETDPYVVE